LWELLPLNRLISSDEVVFRASKDVPYQISVDGQSGVGGPLQLLIFPVTPPPNDDFANRTLLTGSFVSLTTSNVNATIEPFEPSLGFTNENQIGSGGNTIWFEWTATTNSKVIVHTFGSTLNDSQIGVFSSAASPAGLTNLVLVANNDDFAPGTGLSRLEFQGEQNRTYFIALDNNQYNLSGDLQFTLFEAIPPRLEGRLIDSSTFQLRVIGTPEKTYWVQESSTLRNWVSIFTNSLSSTNLFEIQVPVGPGGNFFRAVEVD
jgi:hypothetical protein